MCFVCHADRLEFELPYLENDLKMHLSADEVLQLSPDDSSTKAAKGLVIPAKWPRLEFSDHAVWGECQGSGSKPYQVQVDKSGPAFRCTCPSRKFPCKHGLALLLILAQNPSSFSQVAPPAWVSEWLSSRKQRAEKQEEKNAEAPASRESATEPQGAARRETSRLQRMAAGLEELERWLNDRLRQGLAQLPGQTTLWSEVAVRMVDAQLPGLAFRLRRISSLVGKGEHWPARVLGSLGQLRLLIEAFRRLESLPPAVQDDVRTVLGITTDRDVVLASGERVSDDWLVLGQSIDEEERLWVRRVWLQGTRSGRRAMVLDYAHGTRRFEQMYVPASCLNATMAFFPGNSPLRALVVGDVNRLPETPAIAHVSLEDALESLATAVATNPWQWPLPLLLDDGVPREDQRGWHLQTAGRGYLPLNIRDEDGWQLLAESGGAPLTVFGEWDGEALRPLSAWHPELVWTEGADSA